MAPEVAVVARVGSGVLYDYDWHRVVGDIPVRYSRDAAEVTKSYATSLFANRLDDAWKGEPTPALLIVLACGGVYLLLRGGWHR